MSASAQSERTVPSWVAAQVSTDPVCHYLQRIGRAALLSAEEEVDLARRIEVGVLASKRLSRTPAMNEKPRRELLWLV